MHEQDRLWATAVRWPADELALNPELVCVACSKVLCEVEEGDALAVLQSVALDHQCPAS